MSMRALGWVYGLRGIRHGPKSVLLCLAWHCNGNWEAWPGIDTIAEESGLEERQVGRNLDELIRQGLIERRRTHKRDREKKKRVRIADTFRLRRDPHINCKMSGGSRDGVSDKMSDRSKKPDRHFSQSYPTSAQGVSDILSDAYKEGTQCRTQNGTQSGCAQGNFADKLPKNPRKKSPPKPKRKSHTLTAMPDDWPDASLQAEAQNFWREKGRNDLASRVADIAESAQQWHAARNARFVDWTSRWRHWARMQIERSPQGSTGSPQRRNSGSSPYVEAVRELAEEFDAES